MLAQEIIHHIKKPNVGGNVVIKFDMAKAYDRILWSYICLVLRKMGFGETFIDMAWRIMADNWFSDIVNGAKHGFSTPPEDSNKGTPCLRPSLSLVLKSYQDL